MHAWIWIGFVAFVLLMLALDLGVLNRKAHVIRAREALLWTLLCVALALVFNVLVYFMYEHNWLGIAENFGTRGPADAGSAKRVSDGWRAALEFFTGWVIEYSLSLDNIFVIAIIFRYFRVPQQYQHRVLFWGILGALVMRGAMIWAGTELITRFFWMNYLFGAILLFTAVKMLRSGDEEPEPDRNPLVRLARRFYPVSPAFEGQKFFTMVDGRKAMTPMFVALLVVESTDVLFAVDSIPAIFAITRDPFIVFTSNVFAILGLRSLYFALASLLDKFYYLKLSLVFLLAFVGVKMLLAHHYHLAAEVSLAIIVAILAVGIVASLLRDRRRRWQAGEGAAPADSDAGV